ncbi:MAG TPA: alpha/beta hydrolase [Kofleriaceae bacterium]|nr:alpha/beta hydrolase [Kofleriaceae bacterium]
MTDGSLFDTPEFNARLFFPRGDESACPSGAVDLTVDVPGAALHVRWHRGDGHLPTLLLFHGNGEVVSDYDRLAPRFAAAGAALAVMDFRGYGASTGTPTLRSAIEDAPLVLARLAADAGPVLVMGRSLGCACAAELYRGARPSITGFVWESGFTSLDGLIRRRGLRPPPAIDPDDARDFDPIPKLRAGAHRLLVIHGADDDIVPPAEGRAAFDAAGATDKIHILVDGHGHNDLFAAPEYWAALRMATRTR